MRERNINRGFTLEAQLGTMTANRDGCVRFSVYTNELTKAEKIVVMEYVNAVGWILFRENEIDPRNVPTEDAKYEKMTPSQELRWVIKKYWTQTGEKGDFESFYRKSMETLINKVKAKLD